MKQIVFFLCFILFSPVYGREYSEICSKEPDENGVLSFCTEGKTWNYVLFYLDGGDTHQEPYSYVVRGDSVIDDVAYKKFYYQKDGTERLAFMMREEGCKVYKRHLDKDEFLFFDFRRDDVGQVYCYPNGYGFINWMIHSIDEIMVNDNLFRRYCCYQEISETELDTIEIGEVGLVQKDYWVEGIGSAMYGIEADGLRIEPRLPGYTEYFVSCYMNGECLFTEDDFSKPSYTTSIQKLRCNDSREELLYDLQGRCLTGKPAKGLYIQNGRKIIAK